MKTYLVATHSDYTVLIVAKSEAEAVKKADLFYFQEYGEGREDWTAYELEQYLKDESELGAMPIHSWYAWERYLNEKR